MKCFLHIGTEKTGTTTIQSFLNLNRENLLSDGYIYTKSLGKVNNIRLAAAAYNEDRRDNLTKKLGVNSNTKLLKLQENFVNKLKKELEQISNLDSYKTIFSSEHIQSRLTTLEELERLKGVLNYLGYRSISVILYLRNPAKIANSLYSTTIKSGSTEVCPPPPSNEYYANICHHKNTIQRFSSVFGASSVIPKIFDKQEFINNSISEDFLASIGVQLGENYQSAPNRNESLSVTAIEILRRFNTRIPAFVGNKVNPKRANIVEYLKKSFNDDKYMMSNSLFAQYEQEFAESNEWVRKKYFPERDSLFPSISQINETNVGISDSQLDMIVDLLFNIWRDKQKMCSKLRNVEAHLNKESA